MTIPGWMGSTNQRYRLGILYDKSGKPHAHEYIKEEYKAWQDGAIMMIRTTANAQRLVFARRKDFAVSIMFCLPRDRMHKIEVDGAAKPTLDAIAEGLDLNDAWCRPLHLDKKAASDYGVEIMVEQESG